MSTTRGLGLFFCAVWFYGMAKNAIMGDHLNEYGEWVKEDYTTSYIALIIGIILIFWGGYKERKNDRK